MIDIVTCVDKWCCCGVVDSPDVVADVRAVRDYPDHLSEHYVEYTHDPVVHHVTVQPVRVVSVDNGKPAPIVPPEDDDDDQESVHSDDSEADDDGSIVDDGWTDCLYRDFVMDWSYFTAGARALHESTAEGHPSNLISANDVEHYNLAIIGMLCSMADACQRDVGHRCQYRTAVELAVHEGILHANMSPGAELETWRRVHYAMGVNFHEACVVIEFGCGDDMRPAEPTDDNGSGDRPPPSDGSDGSDDGDGPGGSDDGGTGSSGGVPTVPVDGPSSVYRLAQDVVEVKKHRRIRKPNRYAAAVVAEIKNRLGCPAKTQANILAVRRMAVNIMERHGVRPTHVRQTVELVVAGVFVPDKHDLRGAKILQSVSVEALREEIEDARPVSVWGNVFNPFRRRRGDRVRALE
jgi:hypothetical protein